MKRSRIAVFFFHSRYEDGYGIITCKECPSLETPFYFETSLATNKKTGDDYGLVFKHSYTFDDFFIFVITPESQKYALWHHTSDDWSLRLMGESSSVLPYPESNVLGVYANGERLELYINGEIVDTYAESNTSFHGGFWGLYMDNSSFGVHVDDLVIYKVEN